jgi:hypothetical protein
MKPASSSWVVEEVESSSQAAEARMNRPAPSALPLSKDPIVDSI